MENVPEYDLVFLNELHEKLRRLNPQRDSSAGLCRILGRLTEYDLDCQIAKVESCFHHEHMSVASAASATLNPVAETESVSATACSSCTIDLTQDRKQDLEFLPEPLAKDRFIDLTSTTDDDSSDSENDASVVVWPPIDKGKVVQRDLMPQDFSKSGLPHQQHDGRRIGRGGPKVVLWVDTRLLDSWKCELHALFQFIGEVVYEEGHWVLQARTCRNMDGLDLYSYRQSILLTRQLVSHGEGVMNKSLLLERRHE
ncbi:hypothetical protein EDD21DRAFT_58052 [Dissophora ornata]|nr:hypothetical protein BGZ58_004064 [Dissophora ornata]KAI8602906.1 hypothetical protein EDD21DRAFT_58052 [Dissophora ornata]